MKVIYTLKFGFPPREDVLEILKKVRVMERKVLKWVLANRKYSLGAVHWALYYPLRQQFPELHSGWIKSAIKTALGMANAFRRRAYKGEKSCPHLKNYAVSLYRSLYQVQWDGDTLLVVIKKTPKDSNPILLSFKPCRKYKRLLDLWAGGGCKMCQLLLTPSSLLIPLELPSVESYSPQAFIGIDSNENSLDYYILPSGEFGSIDFSFVPKVHRDYLRRVQKAAQRMSNPKAVVKIQRKYGKRARDRILPFMHKVAFQLIDLACKHRAALVLEDLKGIKLRVKDKLSKRLRQRLLNCWAIRKFHSILEVKAERFGVPILYVDPKNTSRECPACGGVLKPSADKCPSCGLSRHKVAAMNIALRGQNLLCEGQSS